MNKNILIGLVVLLALGGGAYLMQSKQTMSPGSQTQSQAMGEATEFARAIESGRPTTCTMTRGDDKMQYHLKDQKMVANITTIVDGNTTLSHMINDQEYIYMWVDGQNQGTKVSATLPSPSPLDVATPAGDSPKLNSEEDFTQLKAEGYTIDCQPDTFSDSVFTPPSNIEFIDPTMMLQAIPSPNAQGGYDMDQLKELQQKYSGITSEDQ